MSAAEEFRLYVVCVARLRMLQTDAEAKSLPGYLHRLRDAEVTVDEFTRQFAVASLTLFEPFPAELPSTDTDTLDWLKDLPELPGDKR